MSDTRIIRVWVDNEFLEIEVDGCANLSEDEVYQAAAEYVYDRISIEVIQMSVWEKVARFCQEVYGSHIDWEERFYICGECGEPIYECDYGEYGDYYSEDGEGPICPVCEYFYGGDI